MPFIASMSGAAIRFELIVFNRRKLLLVIPAKAGIQRL
jgi:hypothetical protein